MKTYTTNPANLPTIKLLFYGFVFRRTENGIGYVKLSSRQKKIVESLNIELKENDL